MSELDYAAEFPDVADPQVDPAEHAQHALIDALTTIEQQIVLATTPERLAVLKALTKRAYDYVNLVDLKCTAQMDLIGEARR
jgi:hypothetical protein